MRFSTEKDFDAACGAVIGRLSGLLLEKGAWLSAAESLTGGLLASAIVGVSGASRWFTEGCVTYTDGAKINRLRVPSDVISRHTAVSFETARAMAEGSLLTSGSDLAVSTTGVAGPGPDDAGHPEGLVYVGAASRHGSAVRELHLEGDRLGIRRQAVYEALKLALELAKTL